MNRIVRSDPAADFSSECRVAVEAAEGAGALLRSGFQQSFGVRAKGDSGDVVTDLDLLAERLVTDRIRERFPDDRIVAEEGGATEGRRSGQVPCRTWLVDPLDGSNNVVIGLSAYVVGIALCVDEEPVLGVVHDPVTDRTWQALSGGGAYGPEGRLTGPARPVPSAGPLLGWTQGHSVSGGDPAAQALKASLESGARRLLQLWAPLLTWSMLARGDIDGFVGYRAEEIDLPAGSLLAAEAGLVIRRLDGGEYSQRIGQPETGRSFVAGRPEVIPYLLKLVQQAGNP